MNDDVQVQQDAQENAGTGSSRRTFLAVGGVAVGGTVLAGALSRAGGKPENLDRLAERLTPASVVEDDLGTTIVVRRSSDQCYVTLAYFNTHVDYTSSPPLLYKKVNGIGVYVIVYFGDFDHQTPMHVAEQAFPLVAEHNFDKYAQKPPHSSGPTTPKPTQSSVDAPPVKANYGGGSRLVFEVPDDVLPLPIDTEHLLNFVGLPLVVAPNAVPPFTPTGPGSTVPSGIGAPTPPSGTVTAIELPYKLIVSPPASPVFSTRDTFHPSTVFVNTQAPVTHDGWTELWHTRLAAQVLQLNGTDAHLAVDETNRDLRSIRAIWCTDKPFPTDLAANKSDNLIQDDHAPDFLTSLTYDDRYDIVRLSSDFSSTSHGGPFRRGSTSTSFGYVPQPATVDNLMLTALGAWLDCDAHWDLPEPSNPKKGVTYFNSSLLSWRHRMVQGRDTYVRVVRKGYLFPWGHKASLITVTEREFSQEKNNGPVGAYLRQKTFIVVTQPVKVYGGADPLMRVGGRHIPFISVEAITLVSPDLETPAKYITKTDKHGNPIQKNAETVFEPMLSNGAFLFHLRGTDWAGDLIDFRSPVLWVDDTAAYGTNGSSTLMSDVFDKWRGVSPPGKYPQVQLHNQRVSVAESKSAGDTQIVAGTMELSVETPKSGTSATQLIEASQPNFYPAMHSIEVEMPEAKVASGNPVGTTSMEFEPSIYLPHGFDGKYTSGPNTGKAANKGKVFLQRLPSSTRNKVKFSSASSGGSITPNLGVDGLSRAIGPISGDQSGAVGKYANGSVDPETIFHGVDAKLMGGLPLSAILGQIHFDEDDTSEAVTLKSVQENEHRTVTHLDWHPTIQTGGPAPGIDVFVPTGDVENSMDLRALIITDKTDPAASHSIVVGQIRDFELHLFGDGSEYFMLIPFDSLTFRAQTGQQTHVDVEIGADGVQFEGALSFVQQLADFLNFDGSGLTVSTAGSAITADLTLAIPTIALGPFALANLAFSAGVAIPYNGDPVRFTFSFCSQENPFQLTIMVFTGGGFVSLGIGADGLEMLAFSFDFGLGFSIDIGIASGQVSLTGGVYYEGEKDGDHQDVTLTAWVKASGGVSALGIVSVSVELYLGLGYQSDGPGTAKLVGDADMTISVHVLFFGGSISIGMHEEFDVSGGSSTGAVGSGRNRAAKHRAIAAADDDPPPDNHFGTTMSADDWQTYCTSFALIGVGA